MPSQQPNQIPGGSSGDPIIDASDSYQIGLLTGLLGGSIPDAAVVRAALQRFEQANGRKATSRDIGMVAGLIKSLR